MKDNIVEKLTIKNDAELNKRVMYLQQKDGITVSEVIPKKSTPLSLFCMNWFIEWISRWTPIKVLTAHPYKSSLKATQ